MRSEPGYGCKPIGANNLLLFKSVQELPMLTFVAVAADTTTLEIMLYQVNQILNNKCTHNS
jgi:hypothetical protein